MKKAIMIPLAIFLFTLFVTSFAMAETEVIPSYAEQIMETWNASTAEELRVNIVKLWRSQTHPIGNGSGDPSFQTKICFGKTTEELIADSQSWNLAIISSKEVDLQQLADKGLLDVREHVPFDGIALHQWSLPEKVQNILPIHPDPYMIYCIYCYSYNAETEETVFMLCKEEEEGSLSLFPDNNAFAEAILSHRNVADSRLTDGSANAMFRTNMDLTYEDLMENSQDWDTALLFNQHDTQIDMLEQLAILDRAGLLYDFAQDDYFRERDMGSPYSNGVMNDSGKMIAIPCGNGPHGLNVFVINSQSPVMPYALEYVKHYVKTYEWVQEMKDLPSKQTDTSKYCISRDEMDW